MSLRLLGLCGVDESVDVGLLTAMQSRYPRAEFGVLFREEKAGSPRYPKLEYIEELAAADPPLRLAAHLCGKRCEELLRSGDLTWLRANVLKNGFRRVQLNPTKVNGVDPSCLVDVYQRLAKVILATPEVEWILQSNDETVALWKPFTELAPDEVPQNVAVLWDASCGLGKVASSYPTPPENGMWTGWAGGLGPLNLAGVVEELRSGVARGKMFWVDMESKLRTADDSFDVGKAWKCCRVVEAAGWDDPMMSVEQLSCRGDIPENAWVSNHPVLAHKVTQLRRRDISSKEFRSILKELTFYLGYEATTKLSTHPNMDIVTPMGTTPPPEQARSLSEHIALVPILRAGLGMVDAMMDLLPTSQVLHIGMFRMPGSKRPIEYYSRLPKDASCHIAFVLDPIIATANTVLATVSKLKNWGAVRIVVLCVIASRQGLNQLHRLHPDVKVAVAQVDEILSPEGWVLPGFGDAGDRQFATPNAGIPDVLGRRKASLCGNSQCGNSQCDNTPLHRPPVRSPGAKGVDGEPMAPPLALGEAMTKRDDPHRPKTLVLGDLPKSEIEDIPDPEPEDTSHTTITTHSGSYGPAPIELQWGAPNPASRGPVLATTRHPMQRNAIGAHSGGYSIYRALAVVSGGLDPVYFPKLGLTTPVAKIGPFPAWSDPDRIVTIDPYGHAISEAFNNWIHKGFDVRPTIAVTKAHIEVPEIKEALRLGRLKADSRVLADDGQAFITKAAIEPVWYLPGVAKRFGVEEHVLREQLFRETNSMYPELITRPDLKLFLPPIGGLTVYIWGDPELIPDEDVELTVRVHDECNGSDVFGSDICTCRPYLTHAIEECIKTAQRGGTGICVYFRKEGRALGEVTKYLVYNHRKRQEGGDTAAEYFNCTEAVAGCRDTRFQSLMPDVLHWLGVTKIHNFISMSDMKHDAIVETGIKIVNRVEIPPEMVPKDAQVEITAKVYHGYHGGQAYGTVDEARVTAVTGREYSAETKYEKSVTEGGGYTGTASGQ